MGRHSKVEPEATRAPDVTGSGSHRSAQPPTRRGIAKWPIAALATVLLVGLGVFSIIVGNSTFNTRADANSGQCTEGRKLLRIAAAPEVHDLLSASAHEWNAEDRPVQSHCVIVETEAVDPADALDALRQDDDAVRAVPAVWVADSADWTDQLADSHPGRIASTGKPIQTEDGQAYPYVTIGGTGVDPVQQRAAQRFRHFISSEGDLDVAGLDE